MPRILQRFDVWALLTLTLAMCSLGCGGPHGANVSGTVTLDGKPLANANVTFHPAGGEGAIAYGQTNASGNYVLATGTEQGLAPGDYAATVIATVEVPPETPNAETTFKPITPAKYADVEQTDLMPTVTAGSNDIPLALTSQ
jgi:hypothetical protein